jgi:transglutaminase-like putative cysteine protease
MQITSTRSIHKLLAKIILVAFPIVVAMYYILVLWNEAFELPTRDVVSQAAYFAIGVLGGMLFYVFGFRFVPTYLLLIIGLYFLYKGVDATAFGEFDTFYLMIQFIIFAILFSLGWLAGWGIIRTKSFVIIFNLSLLVLFTLLLSVSEIWSLPNSDIAILQVLKGGFSIVIICLFITIVFHHTINNLETNGKSFWWSIIKRVCIFCFILGFLYVYAKGNGFWKLEEKLIQLSEEQKGGGENGLLQKKPDTKDENGNVQKGGYALKDKLSMGASNPKMNILVFTAYINNFFQNTDIPNPLYLVSAYYTKYDPSTEAFEIDKARPSDDHFSPQVGAVPLYHIVSDTVVLKPMHKFEYLQDIEFEIYNKNLDPNFYIGPTTSYFLQPISIDPSFRKEYINAYRGKSRSSQLNSAYFVYNSEEKSVIKFQDTRTKILQQYTDYSAVDSAFLKYYTAVPVNDLYKRIDSLTHEITKEKSTVIDKVNAIKNYFFTKDKNGKNIFKYSDNPGEPNLPGASRLEYFLFQSKQGYCAYYATATLYMLRSLGIPSRVVGGFLTEDRSANKNKGWYWYYSDQAHAWVQVFFPGIGWIDFDTTIGNDDARESPQSDGTPPLQPKKAILASYGTFESVDTVKKMGRFKMMSLILFDKPQQIRQTTIDVDLSLATVVKDTATLLLKDIQMDKPVTILSYAKVLQKLKNTSSKELVSSLPLPLPVDEVHLMEDDIIQPLKNQNSLSQPWSAKHTFILVLSIILLLGIIILSLPYIYYRLLLFKLNNASTNNIAIKAYNLTRWINVLFINRNWVNDADLFKKVDSHYRSNTEFVLKAYHDYKYGNVAVQHQVQFKNNTIQEIKAILKSIKPKHRWKYWIQISKLYEI